MTKELFDPPAIIKTSVDEAFNLVKSLARRTQEDALALGLALIEAKALCPHGEWIARLKKSGVSEHIAQRLMRKARRENQILQDAVFDPLDDDHGPATEEQERTEDTSRNDEETTTPESPKVETIPEVQIVQDAPFEPTQRPDSPAVPPAPPTSSAPQKLLCRAHRTGWGKPDPDCKECAELNKPKDATPEPPAHAGYGSFPETGASAPPPEPPRVVDADGRPVPYRLLKFFEVEDNFDSIEKRSSVLANLMQQKENSPLWKAIYDGKKSTAYSTYVRLGGARTAEMKPVKLCPNCGTEEEPPSETADPCDTCDGKGFLTAGDLKE